MNTSRLFFAALPDPVVAERLVRTAAALPPGSRAVRRDNLHLTLAFLGEVPDDEVSLARRVGASMQAAAFTLRFDAYEYWPKPAVVVAAARVVPEPLLELWQGFHRALGAHGWALDAKRLRPHVTLARHAAADPVLPPLSVFDWPVTSFSLMRSQTGGSESIYTVVDTWSLLDNAAAT